MVKIAFFDSKPYDISSFEKSEHGGIEFKFIEDKLNRQTAILATGCDGVCAFVNDTLSAEVINSLSSLGVKLIAMRCAGYNNVDFKSAFDKKIAIVRVPAYSPYSVAEFAMAMLLTLNRRLHKAYNRTREYNFSLNGLCGEDLHGKTMGVIGTGKIGRVFIDICRGFGMKVLASDPFPAKDSDIDYRTIDELFESCDYISLHCPLTNDTYHIVNKQRLSLMKQSAILINTSRGALVDSEALLDALREKKIRAAALDVYEEEADFFFEDKSNEVLSDAVLQLLTSMPNVIITSHQAFLTEEALGNIAETTIDNINAFFGGRPLPNEICYHCVQKDSDKCRKREKGRCF